MRNAAYLLALALAATGCEKSAQERLAERELAKAEADDQARQADARLLLNGPRKEGEFEKMLSFKCAAEWRDPKRQTYGDSWLSAACRKEIDAAKAEWTKKGTP